MRGGRPAAPGRSHPGGPKPGSALPACVPTRAGAARAASAAAGGRARSARRGQLARAPIERESLRSARGQPGRRRGRGAAGGGGHDPGRRPAARHALHRGGPERVRERRLLGRPARGRCTAGGGGTVPAMSDLSPDYFTKPVADVDPEIAEVLKDEAARQERTLEMIASENFVPQAVLDCQGSVLTNKYAEGYPGRRYYGGCEHVDVAEQLAIDRAKALFGADHVNVQPHAGAQTNAAVYHALIQPGDTIMGMKLDQGGHLSHGMKLNVSGRLYNVVAYGVDAQTSRVNMEEVSRVAEEFRPKI